MKPTYEELVAASIRMRLKQKLFWRLRRDKTCDVTRRSKALGEAFEAERAFDRLLEAATSPQKSLMEEG